MENQMATPLLNSLPNFALENTFSFATAPSELTISLGQMPSLFALESARLGRSSVAFSLWTNDIETWGY